MGEALRLFGNELSPYSVKVRSYLRYKDIPHVWIVRDATNQEEYARYAKLPLIPLLVFPDGTSLQDSTPIIEHLESRFPEPSIQPIPRWPFSPRCSRNTATSGATNGCSTIAGSTSPMRGRRPNASRCR